MKKEILSCFDNKNAGLLYCYTVKKEVRGGGKTRPPGSRKRIGHGLF